MKKSKLENIKLTASNQDRPVSGVGSKSNQTKSKWDDGEKEK